MTFELTIGFTVDIVCQTSATGYYSTVRNITILILMLEIASRALMPLIKKTKYFKSGYYITQSLSSDHFQLPGMFEHRPYSIYWNRPNYFRNGYRITNSLGYRFMGEYDPDNLSSNSFKILILGGSTTFSDFHSDDFEDSWTHRVGTIISAHNPDKDFRIFNAGLNAGMSSELLAHFVFEVQKISPDLVIIHGPGNDLLPILLGDVSTDYRLTRRIIQFGRRPGERFLLRHIGLFRFLYTIWLSNISLSFFSTPNMPSISTQAQNAIDLYPSQFAANLKMFVGICRAFEMKLLLVDFLQAPQPKLLQIWPDLAEASQIAIQKMNSSMEDEACVHKSGVYHVKFDSSLFHEDFFLDNCHLNAQGENVKAKVISDFLLRNKII